MTANGTKTPNPAADPSHPLVRLMARPRPLIMGILNVTPDSFSDGGQFDEATRAAVHAARMVAEGADILDIGGESTRPYGDAVSVSADDEWARVAPALDAAVALGVPISIDTMKAEIAERALGHGATIVNDVWGLQRDPAMAGVVARHGAGLVIMHNRIAVDPAIDVIADIIAFFERSLDLAERAGIPREHIVLDPGIGFGKTPTQSFAAIANLDRFARFGLPLLMGLSRKRFIASVSPSEPHQRLAGSIAGNLAAARAGAAILRVHDVAETVQALRVDAVIRSAMTAPHG
jgi:dihydropteroate synthase